MRQRDPSRARAVPRVPGRVRPAGIALVEGSEPHNRAAVQLIPPSSSVEITVFFSVHSDPVGQRSRSAVHFFVPLPSHSIRISQPWVLAVAVGVKLREAGEGSRAPAALTARADSVWSWPSFNPDGAMGELHGLYAPPSMLHSNVAVR